MVRCLSENTNSGIFVSESLSSGQPIPVRRSTVVAFLGSAPRGPVGIPVSTGSIDEYLNRFGVPGCDSPLIDAIRQFFMNGGVTAIVVRVCSSARRHHIDLPGPFGVLTLEAINPGAHELLRASIDYDGIPAKDKTRFNLVIHRLASRDRPIVVQQEVYRGLSIEMADTDFIGHALSGSELVCIKGKVPEQRPDVTFRSGIEINSAYIYVDTDWPETVCLTDYDLIGCNTEGTGLFALNQVPSVDLVILLPDESDLGPVALFTAERYCRERNAILLIDPPTHWQSVDDAIRSARESGFASPNVALYFPRPNVPGNPSASALGAVAGALATRDAHEGVWGPGEKVPLEMRGHPELSVDLDIEEQSALKRVGINALRRTGPSHFELTGLVTMNRGSGCVTQWDDLCLRRTVLIIIDSIMRGTRWAAFQDNDSDTSDELCRQVKHYLHELFINGALSGENTEDAGYFICDKQTMEGETGVAFVIGFMPLEYGMQSIRFHQHPTECQVQMLHIKHSIALAS